MEKNIILFLFVFSLLLPLANIAAQSNNVRPLEIVYPKIPGVQTPEYVSQDLPQYVKYLFRLAVIVIGLLIFGILIYSGVSYLLSFGNPSKLSDAKQGIGAAVLGGAILLGAFLVFNTINPQLVILKPPEVGLLKAVINPGVYLCNYKVDDIGDIMSEYISSDTKARLEGAERLKKAIVKTEKEKCFRVNYSGILNEFYPKDDFTLFIVPSEKYIPTSNPPQYEWVYEYGVVFHENNKFGDRCQILPEISDTTVYGQVNNFFPTLDFRAESITVFKKPAFEPTQAEGVTLYEGLSFNELGKTQTNKAVCNNGICEEGEQPNGANPCLQDCGGGTFFRTKEIFYSLSPLFSVFAAVNPDLKLSPSSAPIGQGVDVNYISEDDLDSWGLYHNTRSITIAEKDTFIAVLLGAENECEVRKTSDNNLTDDPIGRCGTFCRIIGVIDIECFPCLESLYVIKGQAL